MNKWQQVNLGEAIDILSGYAFKSKDFCDKGVPVLKIQNVTNSGVLLNEDTVFVSEDTAAALLKYKVHYDDILITMTGSNISQFNSVVGRVSKVKFAKPAMLNQRVGKILLKDKDSFCLDYIFYFLSQESTKIKLAQKASGSANQANISPAIIKSLKIPMPPIEVQRKIADVLSAYDDLIENNRKQIRLLEEAAQRLYKEWFINLRFPGHETTKIINGIPAGWEKSLLGNLIEIKYGKDHKNIPAGDIPVYGSGGFMRKCSQALHQGEAVLIPRKGSLNNIMYVNETFWTVDTMFYALMKQQNIGFFTYFLLKSFDMYAMNIGAAVPSMTTSILNAIDVVLPSAIVLEEFHRNINVLFKRISTLNKQNDNLMETRDRLLQKLIK